MNPRQLEVFDAIMRERSISDAARALGITQPAVTKSLRLTEQELGVALFRRVGGRLFPSAAAEIFAPEVARVLGELAGVVRLSKQLRHGRAGRLVVAALPAISEWIIPRAILEFRRRWPTVQVEVQTLPSKQVIELVARREVDLGLVYDPSENPYIETEDVCQTEAVFIVHRQHPLAGRSYLGPEDLGDVPLIGYRDDTYVGSMFQRALHAAGVRRELNVITNYSHLSFGLVWTQVGIAIVDPFAFVLGASRDIVTVPFRPVISIRARVLWARERPRSPASRAFVRTVHRVVAEAAAASGSIPIELMAKSTASTQRRAR